MTDHPTCGQGLAEHAALPAKLAELHASMADVLEAHRPALDLTDHRSRKEDEAYRHLAGELRQAALQLEAIGKQMADYQDLPMGRHNERALVAPAALDSFQRFVSLEQELFALLQRRVEQHRAMLAAMGVTG